jgi:hypothetical protein
MWKTKKKDELHYKAGDKLLLTNGEKIEVEYVAESKYYLQGHLIGDTPRRDHFDDGVRQTDKSGIQEQI